MRRGNVKPQLAQRLIELVTAKIPFEELTYRYPSFDKKIGVGGYEIRYQKWLGKTADTCITIIERYDAFGNFVDENFHGTPEALRLPNSEKVETS
jgi:hypothetical protein